MNNELGIDLKVKNLESTVRDIKKKMTDTGKHVEKDFTKKTESGISRIGNAFSKLQNIIAAAFVATGILAFGKRLLNLGSQLDETQSKFDNVFGPEVSKQLSEDLDVMSEAVGRSKLSLLGRTASLGNVLQPLGFTQQASADLSKEITKLAIDVASFNNVPDDQAINAMTKALLGEREALVGLDIKLSEAQVSQRALELAQKNGLDATAQGTRALATYDLMLENTNRSQTDAVRTSGSFANQLKRLQGIITDTFANAGKEVSQDSAELLETIGTFIQKYGAAFFAVLIEIGKAIGDFFGTIGEVVYDIAEAMGISLGNSGDATQKFGNVMLFVLNALGAGIRTISFLLTSFVSLVIAVAQDMGNAFSNGVRVVSNAFRVMGTVVTDTIDLIGNNIIAGIQEGVNGAIDSINKMIERLESIIGRDLFGKIGDVGNREMKNLGDVGKDAFDKLQKAQEEFGSEFGQNTKDAFDGVKSDFFDLGDTITDGFDNVNNKVKDDSDDMASVYDSNLKSTQEIIDGLGDSAFGAGDKSAKGAGKAKDATDEWKDTMKDLENEYKSFEDQVGDLEKATEDLEKANEKMTKTIKDGLRDVNNELSQTRKEYQDTLEEIDKDVSNEKNDNIASFVRSQAEREAQLQEELAQMDEQIKKAQQKEDNQERVNSLLREQLELQKSLTQVQENLGSLEAEQYEGLINAERDRASLSDDEVALVDFQAQQEQAEKEAELARQQAEEKYNIELERLERQRKIYEAFQNMEEVSVEALEELKNNARLESLSLEEEQLLEKLINERIEYQSLVDDKLKMEQNLARSIRSLSNTVTLHIKNNVNSLSQNYNTLIGKIQRAIQAQRTLSALRMSQRYKGGPVSKGKPYWVGENPDGSFNNTTELFVPRQSGTIVSASNVQKALKQMSGNVDKSKTIKIENLNAGRRERPSDIISRLNFKI